MPETSREFLTHLFITGVGTGVGKTLVTTILCHQLRAKGRAVSALKPVVSGFDDADPESDPVLILRSLGVDPSPEKINAISPWRFQAPLAPHEAARREGRRLTLDQVVSYCREAPGGRDFDTIQLIEGAGGVMSPIAEDGTCLDLMYELGSSALLVTGTYLGAISHTLTALSALESHDVGLDCIVVSESAQGVGLAATVEALRHYGGGRLPLVALPRLAANPDGLWHSAPHVTSRILAEADHD